MIGGGWPVGSMPGAGTGTPGCMIGTPGAIPGPGTGIPSRRTVGTPPGAMMRTLGLRLLLLLRLLVLRERELRERVLVRLLPLSYPVGGCCIMIGPG